jgi:prepilin-type processing-associated H-X9-DG protein
MCVTMTVRRTTAMSNDVRYQFSLRDMLVLTTVIGVGLCLLLMAIENSRHSGGAGLNTQCKNNIRNLAMAVDVYQSTSGAYPGRRQTFGGQTVPWLVTVLPQIERLDLYKDWADPKIKPKPKPYLELFVCPQDPPAKVGGPVLSYVANAGTADLANVNAANGVFFDLTASGAPQLTGEYIAEHDGKSNTIILSENLQATTWDSLRPYDTIFLWHPTTHPSNDMRINGGDIKSPVNVATARPSSRHRGGVNVAFADYHVIFLNEKIDYRVYMQLMTPCDKDSDMPHEWQNIPLDEQSYR